MPIRLQERDWQCFGYLAQYGMATAPELHRRHYGSCGDRAFRRRMALCYRAGLLKRFSIGEYFLDHSRKPYCYSLTESGAEAVRTRLEIDSVRVVKDLKPSFVAHYLGVANFFAKLDDSCREIGAAVNWLMEYDPTPEFMTNPRPRTKYQQRYVLHETLVIQNSRDEDVQFSYRPDGGFHLEFKGHHMVAYLEVDHSTEPTSRIVAKAKGVHRVAKEQRFKAQWNELNGGESSIRVLMIVNNRKRLRSVASALKGIAGSELFRFAIKGELNANVMTSAIWSTVSEAKPRALINA